MSFSRIIILIIDACGVGELPDAAAYGDQGSATLPNLSQAVGGLSMPVCHKLGLGNIAEIVGIPPVRTARASYGKMAEISPGKDSTSGHWEIAGIQLKTPFPLFPDGFPEELVSTFEKTANVTTIGNIAASGTEIINQLGSEHLETGKLILYTSADSVFQLAAHEEVVPLEEQYRVCQVARDLLTGEYAVGRVIARPFVGSDGDFRRTSGRRDFSLEPLSESILDILVANDHATLSIGKIFDLFAGRGISRAIKTSSNREGMEQLCQAVTDSPEYAMIFANLVDFDQLWGHRNDETNFARALQEFDQQLSSFLPLMSNEDLLIISADHGCDPTIKNSTDHSREYVPLLAYSPRIKTGVNLGVRTSFSDIAVTIAENFELKHNLPGTSFLKQLQGEMK
ncbi:MAG: phosphopentomutase [bacterium]|nr:phosphopentomutase [bacterium]